MIVNLEERNITAGDYAYVKEGTVRKSVLKRACSQLPFVIVGLDYKIQKPFYDAAVSKVRDKALAVFNIYGGGDARMVFLLKACREEGIELEKFLNPDRRLQLHGAAKAVDLVVLDYLENKVLSDVSTELMSFARLSEETKLEAIESIKQLASLAAAKISDIVSDHHDNTEAVEAPKREFREKNLRAAVEELNSYSSALRELTS